MAQVAAYATLYPNILPKLPAAPPAHIMLQALQDAGRDFCRRTDAWREDVPLEAIVDYKQDYKLTHGFTAEIQRIQRVAVNHQEVKPELFDLVDADTLRFASAFCPHDQDDQLLLCATAGATAIATWTPITDGALTVAVDSSTYSLTDITFAAAADMDDVAALIQNALRASMTDNVVEVRYETNHFAFYTPSGTMGYLTAGASGTDISGASYCNGLTGAGTLAGMLAVKISLRPQRASLGMPAWFLDRYMDGLIAGALADLASQRKKPWTDEDVAVSNAAAFVAAIDDALAENARQYKSGGYDLME